MKNTNKLELVKNLINDGMSNTFASIEGLVEEKLLKRGNPLKDSFVTKQVQYNVSLNSNYTNAVNNQRNREDKATDFKAKENWFKPVFDSFNGSIVCHSKDEEKLYLKFICKSAKVINYFVDGVIATEVEVNLINEFKPKKQVSPNQGLEKEVIVRVIGFDNIKEIKSNKVTVKFQ